MIVRFQRGVKYFDKRCTKNLHVHRKYDYSALRLFMGLAIAALID